MCYFLRPHNVSIKTTQIAFAIWYCKCIGILFFFFFFVSTQVIVIWCVALRNWFNQKLSALNAWCLPNLKIITRLQHRKSIFTHVNVNVNVLIVMVNCSEPSEFGSNHSYDIRLPLWVMAETLRIQKLFLHAQTQTGFKLSISGHITKNQTFPMCIVHMMQIGVKIKFSKSLLKQNELQPFRVSHFDK